MESIALWKRKRAKYPFFAQSKTQVKPQGIDPEKFGHHLSCVFDVGVRTWAFETAANRDRFVNQYRGFEARPCKDPFP